MNESQQRAPALFLGHGSPMNAIVENDFTRTLNSLGKALPEVQAILCVSAHWLSAGTWVTHMDKPRTIHDFYGFPKELHSVQYPAPGSPEIADLIRKIVTEPEIHLDDRAWGLDHGTWSVLRHLYPGAELPVIQLSIDMSEPASFHFELGKRLRFLRERGVLIVGSGNIVHNLRRIEWDPDAKPYDWALEFDDWVKSRLENREIEPLCNDFMSTQAGRLSVPTPDHYLPLLYVLGAGDEQDRLHFEYEAIQNGSIAMRCLSLGLR